MEKTFIITEAHPFSKKINDLYDYMEKNGITLSSNTNGLSVIDKETDIEYHIQDADSNIGIEMFPSGCEFKITYEKEV